ncbi:hypothetical protein [Spirosoma montaniterrae]|uniref:Lipocalin-like domain-containing protein n=1 Tax=Spirosoma montaniterrae TaxID=1178516 RepID=A0A1P9WXM5_9BACT|nr:hypothetical protein [Spirosoma montaniterrae]AQG80109.1 hypothetical protein AWR27_12695 [Spirosoma montaniterrae]
MKKLFGLCVGAALLTGCQTKNPVAPSGIVGGCAVCGTWTYDSFEQRTPNQYVTIYRRTNEFTNAAGLRFLNTGQFLERANAGWCGTPPIAYADYPDQWRTEGDSLAIDGQFWGGSQRSKIAVLSVDDTRLIIQRVYKR